MASKFGGVPVSDPALAQAPVPARASRFGGVPVEELTPLQAGASMAEAAPPIPAVGEIPELDATGSVKDFPVQAASAPTLEERTRQLGEDYVGRGEALLSLITGATGGTVGMVGGTIGGVLKEIAGGEFGTRDAADRIEASATDASKALTYAPRTESGRETVQAIGETLAPLAALGPMTSELAAIGQGVKNVAPIVRGAIPSRAPVAPAAAAARVEPTLGAMGAAPSAAPTVQQSVEGLAKSITDSAQATGKKRIPTMERLASEVMPDETILQAADRLGIRDRLIPSQFSRSQAYREIEQGLASIPGSQLNAQQKQAAVSLAQKADDLIKDYGGDIDKAALSSDFKSRGLSTIESLTKQSDELYNKVTESIPATTKITADSTVGYLTNKAKEMGGAEALSPIERRTLSMLSGGTREIPVDPNSPVALASYGRAKAYERILPSYARVDQLRKQVGEGLRGRGAFKDAESGSLKQLYARLSDDQQAAADSLGAGEMFSAAKQLVASRKAIEDDLAAVLGKDLSGAITSKTGNAIKRLGAGDYKDFDKIMKAIPEDQRQRVVMTSLNDAFTSGSRMEKQLSAPGFVDWYEGLQRNGQARSRLTQYMPKEARSTLDDIFKVAKGMREASKERITTGRIQGLMENFAQEGGMLSKLYGIGKQVAVAEGAGSAIGVPGAGTAGVIARVMSKDKTPIMKAADELLSSQQFKSAISEYTRSGDNAKRAAAVEKTITASSPYRNWFNSLDKATQTAVKSNGFLNFLSQQEDNKEEAKPSQ
jgi:hypothetical protein